MRLIDADRLKAVLENLKAHAEEHGIFPAFSVLVDYVIEVIGNQPTIVPPPNNPLTLEELRGMVGEPVWVAEEQRYGLLRAVDDGFEVTLNRLQWGKVGGMTFYRRRPEEE